MTRGYVWFRRREPRNRMKVRISNNTLCMRLLPRELATLASGGRLVEELRMGDAEGAGLRFTLLAVDGQVETAAEISADLHGREVEVRIVKGALDELAETDLVSKEEAERLPDGTEFRVVVERDLKPRRRT